MSAHKYFAFLGFDLLGGFLDRAFRVAGPAVWNILRSNIRRDN